MRPLVTIALSMRNSAATIDAALGSLVAQTWPDWELRLYDDGSTDDSLERVRRRRDPRIHIVADGVRRGLAARMNQAIDAAAGAYLARMDADDIAYPERLARQVEHLDAHPEIDLLGAAMMIFRDDGAPVGRHPVHLTHETICARPYRGFYLPHPSWTGRIEWFRKWRYDVRYTKAQDQDLLRRAWRESCYAALDDILVGYRQDRLSLSKSWQSRRFVARSVLAAGLRDGRALRGAHAAVLQGARAVVDTVAIATGTERRLLGHRALPFTAAEGVRWAQVWSMAAEQR